jgi:hypothetical protein
MLASVPEGMQAAPGSALENSAATVRQTARRLEGGIFKVESSSFAPSRRIVLGEEEENSRAAIS